MNIIWLLVSLLSTSKPSTLVLFKEAFICDKSILMNQYVNVIERLSVLYSLIRSDETEKEKGEGFLSVTAKYLFFLLLLLHNYQSAPRPP